MWKRKLMKNKVYAIILIVLGAVSVWIDYDGTVLLFTLLIGIPLFFATENWII